MILSIENGRKEDGNRSIADKIIKRLHDLDKTVENNQGRWAWELLQNAKDSIAEYPDRKVAVKIVLEFNKVEFSHNGMHFTEQDIRGLINQISSKEIEEGVQTRKTGRFGTGFLTTHLLSKIIQIKGIVETEDNELFSFQFPLNREGKNTSQLIPRIEEAWNQFHKSTQEVDSFDYTINDYNTSFSYHLETQEQRDIAKIGIEEFLKLIPYVLAFIPAINKVEIIDHTTKNEIAFENNQNLIDKFILPIIKTENGTPKDVFILYTGNDKISIATEVIKKNNGFSFVDIKKIPKLFCDFPLIGTESFHFPVIVNSFFFNPQTERDGIWLKGKNIGEDNEVEENQTMLVDAVSLFSDLIVSISGEEYFDFYNVADTRIPLTNDKYFDESWFREQIQRPLQEIILNANIVELEDHEDDKKSINDLWFPSKSYTKENQLKLWQYIFDLYPSIVCKKDHVHNWCEKVWGDDKKINYSVLISTIAREGDIFKLSLALNKDENQTFDWLNAVCNFVIEEESNILLLDKNCIIPNQHGVFLKKVDIFLDEIQDSTLVEILFLLGDDWKSILLNDKIDFGTYQIKTKKDIADKIAEKLKNISNNENTIAAISLLSEWFESNQDIGKDLFADLYRKRAELFMNTIVDKESLYKVMRSKTDLSDLSKVAQALEENPQLLENLQKTEELTSILKEFHLSDVTELKKVLSSLENNYIPKLEITQEDLASWGVTSLAELEDALKDKNIAAEFVHTSRPNVEAFFLCSKLNFKIKE